LSAFPDNQAAMPQDRYTRDKLKTLKKIYDSYNLPCRIADLRKYEEWYIDNKENLPWKDRWHNMLLFTRSILNPNYTWKDISEHDYNILICTWNRQEPCQCKMCKDNYNPKGFMEYPCANYKTYIDTHRLFSADPKAKETPKCHTLEIDNNSVKIEKKKSFFQRFLLKIICN
jgi:hypothetical protein